MRVERFLLLTMSCALFAGAAGAQSAEPPAEPAEPAESAAATESPTELPEPRERLNAIAFGAAYKFHSLTERESRTEARLPENEHLVGFVIAYERTLIPEHLELQLAKPFLFNGERFDSPLDIVVRGLFPKGAWEPLVGLGLSGNLRVFEREREEAEGARAEFSLGIIFEVGFSYFFTPRWALELELAYIWNVWVSTRSGFEHELAPALGGVFHF